MVVLCREGFWANVSRGHTREGWNPHNSKSYLNVYFNENFLQYKCKISCLQNFQVKSTQSRGFSIMWWFLTNYDKEHARKWWKPHHPNSYQNDYFNENFLRYKWKISCLQNFQVKSTQSRGFSIMCWFWTKYDQSTR